jgi:rubrerythrin
MVKAETFEVKFERILNEYSKRYDIESLSNPNDLANLHTMIRNQLVIEELQRRMHELAQDDAVEEAMNIKKLNDSITALADTNMKYEKSLAIDRKTRKTEQEQSVVDYMNSLKRLAKEFIEERLTKVSCKSCKILVGRISGVYDTTEYEARFQCPQCKKYITVNRKERDIFFDVKDADWRRKYPIEIIQPKRLAAAPEETTNMDNDVVIGDDSIEFGEIGD